MRRRPLIYSGTLEHHLGALHPRISSPDPWVNVSGYASQISGPAYDVNELEHEFASTPAGTRISVLDVDIGFGTVGPNGWREGVPYDIGLPADVVPGYVDDGTMVLVSECNVVADPPDGEQHWQVLGIANDAPGAGVEGIAGGLRRNTTTNAYFTNNEVDDQTGTIAVGEVFSAIYLPGVDARIAGGLITQDSQRHGVRVRANVGVARHLMFSTGCRLNDEDGPHEATLQWFMRAYSLVSDDTWSTLDLSELTVPDYDPGEIFDAIDVDEDGAVELAVAEDGTARAGWALGASFDLGELEDVFDGYVADGTMAVLLEGTIVDDPEDNVDAWHQLGVTNDPPGANVGGNCVGLIRDTTTTQARIAYENGGVDGGGAITVIRGVLFPAADTTFSASVLLQESAAVNARAASADTGAGTQHAILSAGCNSNGDSGVYTTGRVLWKYKAVSVRR